MICSCANDDTEVARIRFSGSHARPFPDFRDAHAPVRLPTHRDPVQPRSRVQAGAESVAAPLVRARRPEHRSADRPSACERGRRSCGTCPAARLADGGKRVAARCSAGCRTRHRQLGWQGRHRGRQSSCAAADRKRWTGWRSPRSRHVSFVGENFPIANQVVSYADFFWAAFTFAHRARCAAAIFFRAAADIVFFLGMLTTFCFCPPFLRNFAHRALWAAAIFALAAAEMLRLVPVRFPYETAVERGERRVKLFDRSCRLIPFFPQLLDNTSQVCH